MALVEGEVIHARRTAAGPRGQAEQLAGLASAVLEAVGMAGGRVDAVAVGTGPGSFTGLRAAIALAHGFSRASGAALLGVPLADALASRLPAAHRTRPLWVATASRRERVYLFRDGALESADLAALPVPPGPVALAGDAAAAVAARLAARGIDVLLTDARKSEAVDVARVAAAWLAAGHGGGAVLPLYVDLPEARPLAGGRPAPDALVAALPAHAGAMAAIHDIAFPAAERWDASAFATLLAQPGVFGWLDPEGGLVLARVAADEAELLTLAVAPHARRRGFGTRLVRASRDMARARGARALFLEVADDNHAARALYAAFGAVEIGRRPAYYPDRRDALLLRADIGGGLVSPAGTTTS